MLRHRAGPDPARPRRPGGLVSDVLRVNPIACTGHGVCAELLPELIELDPWGYPIVSRAELSDENIGISIVYPPDTETPMLEEENKIKPEETKLITGVVKTWSPEAVADCIEEAGFGFRYASARPEGHGPSGSVEARRRRDTHNGTSERPAGRERFPERNSVGGLLVAEEGFEPPTHGL